MGREEMDRFGGDRDTELSIIIKEKYLGD